MEWLDEINEQEKIRLAAKADEPKPEMPQRFRDILDKPVEDVKVKVALPPQDFLKNARIEKVGVKH